MLLLEEIQFLSKGFPFLAMSKFSRMRFRLFDFAYLTFEISLQLFPSPFLFPSYFQFCWSLSCLYSFLSRYFVFLCSFLCIIRVLVSMYRRHLQCWWDLSLLFWIHVVCQCHIADVKPNAWSLVFLFSRPFVEALLMFIFNNSHENLKRGTAQVFLY